MEAINPLVLRNLVREQNGQPALELNGSNTEEMFRDAVRRSGIFSYAGCVSDRREESGAVIDMYLVERAEKPAEPTDVTIGDVVEVFGALAFEHEQNVDLQLRLVSETEVSAEALRDEIVQKCADGSYKLLWEEEMVA